MDIRMTTTLDRIRKQIEAGKADEARRALEATAETDENRCELLVLRGFLKEMDRDLTGAFSAYDAALRIDPRNTEATFRSARLADLCGDDMLAMERYERCTRLEHVPVHALVNLAVLYEERGKLREAEACLRNVVAQYPNHFRARHFLKSVRCSHDMVFDEQSQRDYDRNSAVMDVPIADFELSVRSRNCLRQMNIRTLGDLLRVGEAELLSYKNFGETSLSEIKAMLLQKGLHLGEGTQPVESPAPTLTSTATSEEAIYLNKPVTELELSVRARKCLQMLGVTTLGELTTRTEGELLSMKNFGQTSLVEIKRQLAMYGLSFRP